KASGMVRTKLSALIDSVLSNDLVRIRGSRKIVVNEEEQMITIRGLVRTSDISSDNTVLSYNISEAEIIFKSEGQISSVQEPGWITKLFHWLF
ncbi:MAG: flagellar basal body L-ring protein FlgH, partial [Melioribacteraceae bacterium]|nr:flagellar basal body L-ring protein FlgH [Melioribacteraceae bacterium]